MNVRQTNLALQITTAALLMFAVASIIIGLIAPLDLDPMMMPNQQPAAAVNHPFRLPAIGSFSPLFARNLQTSQGSSVVSATDTADTAPAPTAVPISQLMLVGTIGNSVALIKGPDGSIAMVEAGDDVNGAPVLAIRPSQVDLRINGKVTTLQKSPPPDEGSIIIRQ